MLPVLYAVPLFIIGIILLTKGSDILVDGTTNTALYFGIPLFIISAVIIGFGTSAPELAVSVGAGLQYKAGISLGNIVGSCIANILLILGIGAIIKPIKINIIHKIFDALLVLRSEYEAYINITMQMWEAGLSPDKAGDIVFEAIKDEALYILTDTGLFFKNMAKDRMNGIIEAFKQNKQYARKTLEVY